MSDDLVILPLRLGPFWNFCYVVGSRAAGEALVIDPAWDVPAILDRAAAHGLRVIAAAVTHAHDDHSRGVEALVQATGATVLVHEREAAALRRVYTGAATAVAHEHLWMLGGLRVRLLHTPGHTPGSQSVLVEGALFTGDTLMVGALGRHGAEPDAAESLWRTVSNVLACLPDATAVYPGHDYGPRPTSTLGEERRTNPLLRTGSFDAFVRGLVR